MKPEQQIKVKLNEVNPEPVEVLADSIIEISAAMKAIRASRLSRAAIVALIHDRSKVAKRTIEIVLSNLDMLEVNWLNPK